MNEASTIRPAVTTEDIRAYLEKHPDAYSDEIVAALGPIVNVKRRICIARRSLGLKVHGTRPGNKRPVKRLVPVVSPDGDGGVMTEPVGPPAKIPANRRGAAEQSLFALLVLVRDRLAAHKISSVQITPDGVTIAMQKLDPW